jgi:hypothetical protein
MCSSEPRTRGDAGNDNRLVVGTRTPVAEMLNRRRALSVNIIRHLHERLGISAEVLIRPTRRTGPGNHRRYSLRICLIRAIASSTACSGLMPSAATRWTALPQTYSSLTSWYRQSPEIAA